MIHIIGGREKGRRLKTLKGGKLRPTSEKVREAVFNILGDEILRARVLDVFAGSGAMGIEALSRGAAAALFVESHKPMARLIRRNLEDVVGAGRSSAVLELDYRGAVPVLERRCESFTIVFVDPPYRKGLACKSLQKLAESTILSEDSVVVVEHSPVESLEDEVGTLMCTDRRKYGDTMVSFYRRKSK